MKYNILNNSLGKIIIFHSIYAYALVCLISTILIHPGLVSYKWSESLTNNQKLRYCYCDICCLFKTDSVHHCRKCNECFVGLDHHCTWLNKCIGKNNRKSFILFIFSSILVIVYILITMTNQAWRSLRKAEMSILSNTIIIFYSLNFMILVYLLYFFTVHIKLALLDVTTIELLGSTQKIKQASLNNFIKVFGKNKLTWLLPIKPDLEQDQCEKHNVIENNQTEIKKEFELMDKGRNKVSKD